MTAKQFTALATAIADLQTQLKLLAEIAKAKKG
jgi:hypothetical protein